MRGWARFVSLTIYLVAALGLVLGGWMIAYGVRLGGAFGSEALATGAGLVGGAVGLAGFAVIIDLLAAILGRIEQNDPFG